MAFLLGSSARAQYTWPVYEPFGQYVDGEQLGTNDSLANWNVGNGGTNGVSAYIISVNAAMSFPDLVGDTNPVPKGVESVYINTTSADRGFMFTTNNLTTGAMYASFLLNYLDNGVSITGYSQNRVMFNLATGATDETNGSFGAIYSSVWLTPDYRIAIDKNEQLGGTISSPSAVIATNVPHLIVVRYKVNAGGNDEMDLWIDPMPFGNNGSIPPPTLITTNGPNMTNFNACILNSRKLPNYTATAFYVDEIRLGDTWAQVTPLATPTPGPLFTVTGGGTTCPGSPPHVGLSGSVSTNVYWLYTNNTFSVAMAGTGSALDFGVQSDPGQYSILASNTTTAAIGWMSNSVAVAVIPPPVILTQPLSVMSVTNYRAEFTVGVSGSGFSYQWYLNGAPVSNGTNVNGGVTNVTTGALTNDLVISAVTTANSGNYYCVISNSCGDSSITTTNSLTLVAATNLVWSGDAFSINTWAVGASSVPEFTDPNNNSVFFNQGDGVTFNDSYNGAQFGSTITLSNTLTPTSVTYNTSQVLIWGGPGSIGGPGSLLVNGTGMLKLLNNSAGGFANTFSGGTVISSGTLNMSNSWTGLGTGPVTLSGGTLETAQKSNGTGSSTGLPQNLYVTASSTWQIDKTGNQCAGLGGALLGNSGTTLTISNSIVDNHPEEIRFNGAFTNNCAIATAINPSTTNQQMQIGAFNSSTNVQVYNGAISGLTAAFFVSGAGAVYLNGANTYTNPTFATTGFLAGNGSIAGPLNVSSNATVGGGSNGGIGTFSVGMGMIMTNGSKVLIRVNKSLAQSNDLISVSGGAITNTGAGAGTVTVTNIGATPLAVGDTFQIFSQPVQNSAAFTVTGGGVTWVNSLAANGSVQVALNYVVLTSRPKITSFTLQTANAVISGTNGQAGATAFLLSTTNLLTPLSQWQTVGTNILGGSTFTITATNAVTPGSPQQFFLLCSTNSNH
jgi:hypothetical protein